MASFDLDGEIEQRYKIYKHIGSGAYGVVWCAVDTYTGAQVALKKVFDAFGNQQDAQRTYREVGLLRALAGNPRVVALQNVVRAANNVDLYLVFEIAETDLTVVLRKNILQDVHRKYLTYQLIKVVAQLHARNVIHRDLKPSNVFVNADCTIKLGDFGLARCVSKKDNIKESDFVDLTEYIATRWYRSPEILVKSSVYTTAMDMWAIGCVLGELLTGKPLFAGSSTLNQLTLIVAATGAPTEEDVDSLRAKEAWTMVESLPSHITRDRLRDRLKSYDANAVDLITKLIVFNPTKRLTSVEALQHPYVAEFFTPQDLTDLAEQHPFVLPLPDYKHYPAADYKKAVYDIIAKHFRHTV